MAQRGYDASAIFCACPWPGESTNLSTKETENEKDNSSYDKKRLVFRRGAKIGTGKPVGSQVSMCRFTRKPHAPWLTMPRSRF